MVDKRQRSKDLQQDRGIEDCYRRLWSAGSLPLRPVLWKGCDINQKVSFNPKIILQNSINKLALIEMKLNFHRFQVQHADRSCHFCPVHCFNLPCNPWTENESWLIKIQIHLISCLLLTAGFDNNANANSLLVKVKFWKSALYLFIFSIYTKYLYLYVFHILFIFTTHPKPTIRDSNTSYHGTNEGLATNEAVLNI